jgi:predicted nucleotidyltransferase
MGSRDKDLKRLTKQIVELVCPVRVVLFGSAARGNAGEESDLDILVVVPDGTHWLRTLERLYSNIRGVDTPFDIIVATPSTLEKNKDNKGLVYHAILKEGRTLYAA